jgi:rhodanese-related sulfurtransferase
MLLVGLPGCGAEAKLGFIHAGMKVRHPGVPTVDVAEARQLVEDGAVFVDVRTPEERSVSRIPGAIDQEAVEADPLAYCTVGVRSADWAAKHREDGLDVRNLKGSVLAWAWAGLPFDGPDGETHAVHTWSDEYSWLPDGYEAVNTPPVP